MDLPLTKVRKAVHRADLGGKYKKFSFGHMTQTNRGGKLAAGYQHRTNFCSFLYGPWAMITPFAILQIFIEQFRFLNFN